MLCINEEQTHTQFINPMLEKMSVSTGAWSNLSDTLEPHMKYKQRSGTFLELDLVDSIAISGYILPTKSGEKMYVVEYCRFKNVRRRWQL